MNYYLDESGTTGDLINKKFDLTFANQPIFTHACIGVENENSIIESIEEIKTKHDLSKSELKCEDLYFKNPEAILDIVKLIDRERLPLICEVMDKKYLIAISIVNHYILTESGMDEYTTRWLSIMGNGIAEHITYHLPQECYFEFFELCKKPSEEQLLKFFDMMLTHFYDDEMSLNHVINHMMSDRKQEYFTLKEELGFDECIKLFYPIPDIDSRDNPLALLPHVNSFYYMIAKLNKTHSGDFSDINIIHDTQNEFSATLRHCFEDLKDNDVNDYAYDEHADYKVTTPPALKFVDSKSSIGIQIADIIAGFLNRFTNGYLYKEAEIKEVYFTIMNYLVSHNRNHHNSFGVNFVLPQRDQQKMFTKFNL